MACERIKENSAFCTCTYPGCSKHGRCCECIQFHLGMNELPACCFPSEVEKTFDRSIARFVACHSK